MERREVGEQRHDGGVGGCMCYDRKVTQARARSHRAWGAETRDLNFILRKLESH